MSAEARQVRRKAGASPNRIRRLHRDQGGGEAEDEAGFGEDQRRIDPGPDRNEIEPEQQALERLDRHLDLAAVLRFRQQQPGDEGPERHRQMARRGEQSVAEHHQKTGRHEELGAARLGDEMEERPQGQPAEHDQGPQRQHGGNERLQEGGPQTAPAAARKGAGHHQKRRDGEVLEQEHGEGRAADRRPEPLALDEDGDDDRRRRHAERGADHQGGGRSEAEREGRCGERQRCDHDLSEAEPEHEPPHAPDALERQLDAHGEEERDHAKGGDPVDRRDIADREGGEPRRRAGKRAETVGPERHAREEIAEHRTDPQAEEQRRDHARRRQEQQRFLVEGKVQGLVQGAPPSCAQRP